MNIHHQDQEDKVSGHRDYNYEGERGLWAFVLFAMLWTGFFAWGEYDAEYGQKSNLCIVPPQISFRRHKEDDTEPEPIREGDGRDSFFRPKIQPKVKYAAIAAY